MCCKIVYQTKRCFLHTGVFSQVTIGYDLQTSEYGTILSATASAAMVWWCGAPCVPGKTAWSTRRCSSRRKNTIPCLGRANNQPCNKLEFHKVLECTSSAQMQIENAHFGPRSVLYVDVVTTSANSNGLGTRPAATRPEMCAMSARRYARHLSAIWKTNELY